MIFEMDISLADLYGAWRAFRRGKGLHGCLARAQRLMRKHPTAYMWRTEITKFFDIVHQTTLYQCLQRRPLGDYTLNLCNQIIRSYRVTPTTAAPSV